MPISVKLLHLFGSVLLLGCAIVLLAAINEGDVLLSLFALPFAGGFALLWGFADVVRLLHEIRVGQTKVAANETEAEVTVRSEMKSQNPRSIQEIGKDLERLKTTHS